MFKHYEGTELFEQLNNVKDQIFSLFRQFPSPTQLPEMIEYIINVEENEVNYNCIREFCIFYEGFFFEELSLRTTDDGYDSEEGYVLIWYKNLEGLDLRDKVLYHEIE